MNILLITPGTGNYHCGCSIRDTALARALNARGHRSRTLPLYLPPAQAQPPVDNTPVFYGGLNVYLAQKLPFMRRLPAFTDRVLSHPALLRKLAAMSDMTSASEHGDMTVSMLRGEAGHQAGELQKLIHWIRKHEAPDLVLLSVSLLAGLARPLGRELNVPVLCALQGEDVFLDSLPEQQSREAWRLISGCVADIEAFLAPSRFFAGLMAERANIPMDKMHVIYNGFDPAEYGSRTELPDPPRIGFLSRLCREKGLDTLVHAYIRLRRDLEYPAVKLVLAGTMTRADRRALDPLEQEWRRAGLERDVEIHPNITHQEKASLLSGLSLLSVPTAYDEAFGLYMAEAMLSGVPVVQPPRGAFPELIALTGGGVLCNTAEDMERELAQQWSGLLKNPARLQQLGTSARESARHHFSADTMAAETLRVMNAVVDRFRQRNNQTG